MKTSKLLERCPNDILATAIAKDIKRRQDRPDPFNQREPV